MRDPEKTAASATPAPCASMGGWPSAPSNWVSGDSKQGVWGTASQVGPGAEFTSGTCAEFVLMALRKQDCRKHPLNPVQVLPAVF